MSDRNNPLSLAGRTFLVTGATSGLGRGIAEMIANLGGRVVLVARHQANLEVVAAGLAGSGHVTESYDLNDTARIPDWMKEIGARHGAVSGLVHSAGILATKPLRIQTSQDWEQSYRLNVIAGAMLAKGFRLKGVSAGGGSLVYISSVMGLTGQAGQAIYSATKGALIAMVRSLAVELAAEGIRVNSVAPAVVASGMTETLQRMLPPQQFEAVVSQHPLGLGKVEDVASAVAFLLADTGRWITGTTLVTDGGYTSR